MFKYFSNIDRASLVSHAFALFHLHGTNGSPNTDHQEDEDVNKFIFILTLPPFSQAVVRALLSVHVCLAVLDAECSCRTVTRFNQPYQFPILLLSIGSDCWVGKTTFADFVLFYNMKK